MVHNDGVQCRVTPSFPFLKHLTRTSSFLVHPFFPQLLSLFMTHQAFFCGGSTAAVCALRGSLGKIAERSESHPVVLQNGQRQDVYERGKRKEIPTASFSQLVFERCAYYFCRCIQLLRCIEGSSRCISLAVDELLAVHSWSWTKATAQASSRDNCRFPTLLWQRSGRRSLRR